MAPLNQLKSFLDEEYGPELYIDMVNENIHTNHYKVINYLKINNCLCNDETETIDPDFLWVVDRIATIFDVKI